MRQGFTSERRHQSRVPRETVRTAGRGEIGTSAGVRTMTRQLLTHLMHFFVRSDQFFAIRDRLVIDFIRISSIKNSFRY